MILIIRGRQPIIHHTISQVVFHKADVIKSVINRIAIDASMVDFKHLKIVDDSGNQKLLKMNSITMTIQANIDQTGRAFLFDLIWSMLDEGVVAAVSIDVDTRTGDILSIRVGKIEQWFPSAVRVRCYNERTGTEQSITIERVEWQL